MPIRLRGKALLLALVGLAATVVVVFAGVVLFMSWFSNPPFALGNAPPQPIAFPHKVHVVDNGIQCEFCHRNVTKGEAATVPAVEQCLFCHQQIGGTTPSAMAEIAKVRESFEENKPINWERVHRMPDHVRFVHEAHIRFFTQGDTPERQLTVERTCAICHGDVGSMTEVQPKAFQSLKMGTCLDCHRVNNVPTDCTVCHK